MSSVFHIFPGTKFILNETYLKYCLTLDTTSIPHIHHFHNFLKTFWSDDIGRKGNGIAELEKAISLGDTPNGDISYMLGWLESDVEEQKITYLVNAMNKGNGDAAFLLAQHYYYTTRDYDKLAYYINLIRDSKVRKPIINIFWEDWYLDKAPHMFSFIIV